MGPLPERNGSGLTARLQGAVLVARSLLRSSLTENAGAEQAPPYKGEA
jgi:hypothetical protein